MVAGRFVGASGFVNIIMVRLVKQGSVVGGCDCLQIQPALWGSALVPHSEPVVTTFFFTITPDPNDVPTLMMYQKVEASSDLLYFRVKDVKGYAWVRKSPKSVKKRARYGGLKVTWWLWVSWPEILKRERDEDDK
ncbi:hypothetical protein E3N88_18147 [Mikania micrantha]|uniref:Uncharacterized protein n=1 Tax=Mikania micrantha TaxID=192012 RepID=A0A5N6NU07_9ASTR|nr:hypothetical protein E3N88_18147 [Mikania micrantha]